MKSTAFTRADALSRAGVEPEPFQLGEHLIRASGKPDSRVKRNSTNVAGLENGGKIVASCLEMMS